MPNQTLLLNGTPLLLARKQPALERLIAYLEALPDNELKTVAEIIGRGNVIGRDALLRNSRYNPMLTKYVYKVPQGSGGGFYVYGNPRAITAAQKVYQNGQ